jgi:hypothetical protein
VQLRRRVQLQVAPRGVEGGAALLLNKLHLDPECQGNIFHQKYQISKKTIYFKKNIKLNECNYPLLTGTITLSKN